MRFILSSLLFIMALTAVSAQSLAYDPVSGKVSVEIPEISGKDPVWAGLSLLTSKGIQSRQNSAVRVGTTLFAVLYDKDTKVYSITLPDGETITTPTVAAIRQAVNVAGYVALTGRNYE